MRALVPHSLSAVGQSIKEKAEKLLLATLLAITIARACWIASPLGRRGVLFPMDRYSAVFSALKNKDPRYLTCTYIPLNTFYT